MVAQTTTSGNGTSNAAFRAPIHLPPDRAIIALGGDLKSAISFMRAGEVRSSAVFGDLADADSCRRFRTEAEALLGSVRGPDLTIVHDLHPGYHSTGWARDQGLSFDLQSVQHHHAHIASCLAENGQTGPVIGIACDGTGYGTDGSIWGCEVLSCDLRRFKRVGHLQPFLLPGGDAAARQTWRAALSLMCQTYGAGWRTAAGDVFADIPPHDLATVELMLQKSVNSIAASSLGRLFDGVAFLLGLCDYNQSEAQAAIALENHARNGRARSPARGLPFEIILPPAFEDEGIVMDVRPLIRELVSGLAAGRRKSALAAEFHETVIAMLATTVEMAADRVGIRQAAFSGGCFHNRLLSDGLATRLEQKGITVWRHQRVSPGDAGLSVGQAIIAAARLTHKESDPLRSEQHGGGKDKDNDLDTDLSPLEELAPDQTGAG